MSSQCTTYGNVTCFFKSFSPCFFLLSFLSSYRFFTIFLSCFFSFSALNSKLIIFPVCFLPSLLIYFISFRSLVLSFTFLLPQYIHYFGFVFHSFSFTYFFPHVFIHSSFLSHLVQQCHTKIQESHLRFHKNTPHNI
jgi:hypothetical protein